jgi:hypothetical protein
VLHVQIVLSQPACVVSSEQLDRCWKFPLSCSIFSTDFPISIDLNGPGTDSTRLYSTEQQYGKEAAI